METTISNLPTAPVTEDSVLPFDDASASVTGKTTPKDILNLYDWKSERETVNSAVANTNNPTKAECETAAALLAAPAFNYAVDRDFYINSTGTMFLIKYRANGDTAQGQANYVFYFEKLTAAV